MDYSRLMGFIIVAVLLFNAPYLLNLAGDIMEHHELKQAKPILLLHGSNVGNSPRFSEFVMIPMQVALSTDLGFHNMGLITPATTCEDIAAQGTIIVRATYFSSFSYADVHSYAGDLRNTINFLHECTNQDVTIIAHSLGGVVARDYLVNGQYVDKLITLGSPHQGGLYGVGDLADIFVLLNETDLEIDATQLSSHHSYIQVLNQHQPSIPIISIAGLIDGKGDGLIEVQAAQLSFAENHVVNCGHFALKNPLRCQEAYQLVLDELTES